MSKPITSGIDKATSTLNGNLGHQEATTARRGDFTQTAETKMQDIQEMSTNLAILRAVDKALQQHTNETIRNFQPA